MTNSSTSDKKTLENFFIKNFKYKLLKSKVNSSVSYLYSSNEKHQVIILNFDNSISFEKEKEYIIKKVEKQIKKPVSVFHIVIDNDNQLTTKSNLIVLHSSIQTLATDLEPYFKNTNLLVFNHTIDNELKEDKQPSEETNNKLFTSFLENVKNNKITFSWAVLLILILIPSMLQIVGYFILETNLNSKNVLILAFGGTNWNLTIVGKQWWRIFTYGIAPIKQNGLIVDILSLLILGTSFFSISKITEIQLANTKKLILATILSYLILGLFSSSVLPTIYTGGLISTMGIFIGVLLIDVSGSTTPMAKFSQAKTVVYILILIGFSFFLGDGWTGLLITGTAVILGSAFWEIFKVNIKEWAWIQYVHIFLILAILAISLTFIFLPHLTPALDQHILITLSTYYKKGWFSINSLNKIVNNIGWDGQFNQFGKFITNF
ncbi:hypothetical protein V2P57_02955 [Mycoplasma mycoides subsp. mycoides]|uniref:Membrane protein n=2 Tax=Mycoplasma mycoides subsp. mycoides TaxID=2103 RepID=A0AAE2EHA5_MYCMY|nr:hypothetical protein [Mycoplasma mycoides]AIZ55440.1 hypothetical protein mycmycITA_00617 [Mycoplasma mycoides subsp. mycoides]AME10790.1 hypothetical protein MmmBen_0628 [Mycoplasma mycoides subsp. mycoides]AME11797.1 hypothetical protein MmmBen50_0614 [Mycoplasma mycoides subsp. mycoides]AME12826.1 hypothetical protein MmmBen181_0666 [Mycoplasma mycoides subsp. mycoides]AME13850.1 hypothetical protein MmmBen326_0633 [Mycoplasma mycoides subsp. mycoides]